MSYYISDKNNYLAQYDLVGARLSDEILAASKNQSRAIMNSESAKQSTISSEESKREAALRELSAKRNREDQQLKDQYSKDLREAESKHTMRISDAQTTMDKSINAYYNQAVASAITMPPYLTGSSSEYIAPRLSSAPSLAAIQEQSRKRTYLPQVLTGYQTIPYGNRKCIIPAYAEWQTLSDKTTATTGNIMVCYNLQKNQTRTIDLTYSILSRMLMAFPPGELHLSIIDPNAVGIQRITRNMDGCKELYHHQVFSDSNAIDKHLEMLIKSIPGIKDTYSRNAISLVQHNKDGIKHGYELIVLYDVFNERPSFSTNLKKLMTSGISAGIYMLVIQSENMNPDVMRDFDFSSFNTVINAYEDEFLMHKGNIRWNGKEFSGEELLSCQYLPIGMEGPLKDPLDVSQEKNGIIAEFFKALSEGWEKATKDLTQMTWEDWNEPYQQYDIECWTNKGIEVPIGINADSKEPVYFRARSDSNQYTHSFVQGATGSGKSKLLSAIISGITMKYSPKAVQLYLFDFKDGLGFRNYQGAPHMKWLVTTQADTTMFFSVMKELQKEMERRNNLIGKGNAFEYNQELINRGESEKCLPRIILVVDECQDIYKVAENSSLSYKQREINTIFDDLARKGRDSGIHLLLASQSIPGDMVWISQLANNFILNTGKVSSSRLLPEDTNDDSSLIQKKILALPAKSGAYGTADKEYFTMFAYDDYKHAGDYIRARAEALLGNQIRQFETRVWDGTINVKYTAVPIRELVEFGVNTIGTETIATSLTNKHSNVLLYGAQGGERARQLTMRTVLTSLRGAIYARKKTTKWPTIYIANAWGKTASEAFDRWYEVSQNPIEEAQSILENLDKYGYIQLLSESQLGEKMLELQQQIASKQRKNVLLYIIGAKNMDLFRDNLALDSHEKESSAQPQSGFMDGKWKTAGYTAKKSTALETLSSIMTEGTAFDIHTFLQVDTREDMTNLKASIKNFQYVIFQKANHISYWPDNTPINIEKDSLEKLPINAENARTIFYDLESSDKEELIAPFQLDELLEVVRQGEDVGNYILEHTN